MERKKSVKADLEWRKPAFVQIGLVAALLVVFLAFELVGSKEKPIDEGIVIDGIPYEIIDVFIDAHPSKPIPIPPKMVSIIEIVDNNTAVANEFHIDAGLDNEPDIEVIVEIQAPVEETPANDILHVFVETFPEYEGGDAARVQFLQENLVYPKPAREAGLEGKVFVGFVVERDGSLSNFTIKRSVAPILDEEALRVVKMMPKWKPGKQGGKTVRVEYQVPINFILN